MLKGKVTGGDKLNCVYAELDTRATLTTIVSVPWKYIYHWRDRTGLLYNLRYDPLELKDCAGDNPDERDDLQKRLKHWVETAKRYPTSKDGIELSPEEKDKLKGLGYLE